VTWKLSLPCTRDEAEAFTGDFPELAAIDPPPVLMTSEPDPDRPDEWRLDAYFEAEPEATAVALVRALVLSAADRAPALEQLEAQDWVTLSQAGLEPIRASRFLVHTPAHRADLPEGLIALEVDAGRAFGTGHHETTSGCLAALDRMKEQGLAFRNILAAPLIELAPAIAAALQPGGRLILAGLLDTQADAVATAYRRQGLTAAFSIEQGDWPTLAMRKRRSTGWR